MSKIILAYVQGSWKNSAQATVDWYLQQARTLKKGDADLLIFPELVHTPYFPLVESPEGFDWAIGPQHAFAADFAQLATDLNCAVVFPFFEKRAPGIYHNSVFIFERDGSTAGLYRKSHIPDDPGFYEKYYFIPGDTGMRPIVLQCCTLGVLICWDQWFPEAARLMALQGAQVLAYPTAIGWDSTEPPTLYAPQLDSWITAMRAHSIANGIHTIAVNRVGQEGNLQFWGNSFVTAPDGQVLQRSTEKWSGVQCREIDLDATEQQRRLWPFMRDRRIDQYQGLLQRWLTP